MSPIGCRLAKVVAMAGALSGVMALVSCRHGRPDTWGPAHLRVPPVSSEAYREYKMNIDEKKNIIETMCVVVDGQDIQLPLTAGDQTVQENRLYSFYVWAYNPDEPTTPLELMRERGTFSLEVMGVKAEIRVPDYLPAAGPPQRLLNSVTNGMDEDVIRSLKSRSVLELRIRSQDVNGPFSIVAWFPQKYSLWRQTEASGYKKDDFEKDVSKNKKNESKKDGSWKPEALKATEPARLNPWGTRKDVKVYNGDLRTHVDIVDQQEAEASFGTLFAEHFYVGRVYLRNRHPDKRMVVYTTSLRANVLMYRPPLETGTSNQAVAVKSPKGQEAQTAGVQSSETQLPQSPLNAQETNALVIAASNQWFKAETRLSESELKKVLDKAFDTVPQVLSLSPPDRLKRAHQLMDHLIPKETEFAADKKMDGIARIISLWKNVEQRVRAWTTEGERLQQTAVAMAKANRYAAEQDYLSAQQAMANETNQTQKAKLGAEAAARLNSAQLVSQIAFSPNYGDLVGRYQTATNAIGATSSYTTTEKDRLRGLAREIHDTRLAALRSEALAAALSGNAPQQLFTVPVSQPSLESQYQETAGEIRLQVMAGRNEPTNPFAKARDIAVHPEARGLAFSENSDRQVELSKVGYLWRDTYRPMTFQAVLNSLMYTHDNSWSARTVRILQSLATVAGGMVGLGTVVNEFNSRGYLQGVNLFSTIFVPEIGKLILDDLNKHIRNLGEMAMDTVVVVPPNDVVDRYIFFPKGPIYNFVHEFDVSTPVYIKTIDNDDVGVEATLIDQGVVVQGGSLGADTLVERALNEGTPEISLGIKKQGIAEDNLRRLELDNLGKAIEAALAGTTPTETNGTKSLKRVQAEQTVCNLVRSFRIRYGEDSTGTLAGLLSQYGVDCDNSPPTVMISALLSIDLLAGARSQPFPLPVSDLMGVWALRVTNFSSNPDLLPSTNVSLSLPAQGASTHPSFTLLSAPMTPQAESAKMIETFVISNSLGLSTNLPVPVTIHAARFLLQPIEGISVDRTGQFQIQDAGERASIDLVFPLYNSDVGVDSKTWSFKVEPTETNGWSLDLEPSEPTLIGAAQMQHNLRTTLVLDASLAQTNQNAVTFNIQALFGTNTIDATNVYVKLPVPHP